MQILSEWLACPEVKSFMSVATVLLNSIVVAGSLHCLCVPRLLRRCERRHYEIHHMYKKPQVIPPGNWFLPERVTWGFPSGKCCCAGQREKKILRWHLKKNNLIAAHGRCRGEIVARAVLTEIFAMTTCCWCELISAWTQNLSVQMTLTSPWWDGRSTQQEQHWLH